MILLQLPSLQFSLHYERSQRIKAFAFSRPKLTTISSLSHDTRSLPALTTLTTHPKYILSFDPMER